MLKHCLLVKSLNHPETVLTLGGADWTCLLGQAKAAGMLATLASRISDVCDNNLLPTKALSIFRAANIHYQKQCRDLQRELDYLHSAIGSAEPALLKGAAYFCDPRVNIQGRLLNDIDTLVDGSKLGWTERTLTTHGWSNRHLNHYDENYYRRWMHEVPVFIHGERGTAIDLHHHLVPSTCVWFFDLKKLQGEWQITPCGRFRRLSRTGLIVHSAIHLLLSGETHKGIRDLWDIRCLLDGAGGYEAQLAEVFALARRVGMEKAVGKLLLMVDSLFFEGEQQRFLKQCLARTWSHWADKQLHVLDSAMLPQHWSCDNVPAQLARMTFYLYGHLCRMPLRLLLPHLTTKMTLRLKKRHS